MKLHLSFYLTIFSHFYPHSRANQASKGQIKPKADLRTVDSPKKQTKEFVSFAMKSKKAKNKTISFVFWENPRPSNLLTVLSDL